MVVILLINNKQAKGGTATIVGILLQNEVYCPFFSIRNSDSEVIPYLKVLERSFICRNNTILSTSFNNHVA
jgi:hypothetical protein